MAFAFSSARSFSAPLLFSETSFLRVILEMRKSATRILQIELSWGMVLVQLGFRQRFGVSG